MTLVTFTSVSLSILSHAKDTSDHILLRGSQSQFRCKFSDNLADKPNYLDLSRASIIGRRESMEPISPDDRRTTVQLPPLFTAFLEADQEPPLNPHYSAVRVARQSYVGNSGKFDSKMVTTVARANFAYFAAIIAPNAPLAKYETLVDWGNWYVIIMFSR